MNSDFKTIAIIPAAGAGVRMGTSLAKQFLGLLGKPMLAVTLERIQKSPSIDAIIVVVPRGEVGFCEKGIIDEFRISKVEKVIEGGERRQDSVRLGIEASEGRYRKILIHDGVRPFINSGLIERIVTAGNAYSAVITALPAKETVKKVNEDNIVLKTYDRRQIWMVQTPQIFHYEEILKAHQHALQKGWNDITDDALLMERMGIAVKVVEGEEDNIKITTPHDLAIARFLLNEENRK